MQLIRYEENGRGSSRQVVVGCSPLPTLENTKSDQSGSKDLLWQPQNILLGNVTCVISWKNCIINIFRLHMMQGNLIT